VITNIKRNTRLLFCHQLDKIQQLINEKMRLVHHIISTDIFKGDRKEVFDEAWRNTILQPCLDIGLEIVTNKITNIEKQGVRHYFLGEIEQDSDFTAEDFCLQAIVYREIFLKTQRVPIIVGGSNSYIEKLVEDH
ncbi:hypothetical protein H5410_020922, partial [Solanum commersonii]